MRIEGEHLKKFQARGRNPAGFYRTYSTHTLTEKWEDARHLRVRESFCKEVS